MEKANTESRADVVSPVARQETDQSIAPELKTINHRIDQDKTAELFNNTDGEFEYTEREGRRVRWKLDLILLLMVCTARTSGYTFSSDLTLSADVFYLCPLLH